MDFVTYKYDPHKLIRNAWTYDKKARDAFRPHTKTRNVLLSLFWERRLCILVNPKRAYMTAVTRMKILTPISLGLLTLMR